MLNTFQEADQVQKWEESQSIPEFPWGSMVGLLFSFLHLFSEHFIVLPTPFSTSTSRLFTPTSVWVLQASYWVQLVHYHLKAHWI